LNILLLLVEAAVDKPQAKQTVVEALAGIGLIVILAFLAGLHTR
jgi:hypothetical protein